MPNKHVDYPVLIIRKMVLLIKQTIVNTQNIKIIIHHLYNARNNFKKANVQIQKAFVMLSL